MIRSYIYLPLELVRYSLFDRRITLENNLDSTTLSTALHTEIPNNSYLKLLDFDNNEFCVINLFFFLDPCYLISQ